MWQMDLACITLLLTDFLATWGQHKQAVVTTLTY